MSRILLALLLTLCLAAPAHAVRLFTCGFEENAVLTTTMFSTTVGTVSIGSTAPHSGTYRLDTVNTAGNEYAQRTFTAHSTVGSKLHFRFYFRADDATPTAETQVFADGSSTPALGLQILLETSGVLRLKNVVATTTVDSSVTLSDNTWYRIEAEHELGETTAGSMTMKLYDDTVPFGTLLDTITLTAQDTIPDAVASISLIRIGKTASASVFSYDDIAMNDSTGSVQTSYAGQGKIYLISPNSDVSIKWETDAGGTDNATFAQIDEIPGTLNDADFNQVSSAVDAADALGANGIDRLGLTDLGAEVTANATITLLQIYGRVGSTQGSAAHLQLDLWDEASTKTTGPSLSVGVTGWTTVAGLGDVAQFVYDAAGGGKTTANINSFNIGYEPLTDVISRQRQVAALWVNVEWTEVAASPTALPSSQGFLGVIFQ